MPQFRPAVEGPDGDVPPVPWSGRRPSATAGPPVGEPPPPRQPWSLPLFRPDALFRAIAAATAPVAWMRVLVIPAAVAALFAAAFHRHDLLAHSDRMTARLSVVQHLVVALLVSNLLSKVSQGVAMARRGAPSREMGIKLLMGFLPRFYIDNAAISLLAPHDQRACFAAPLLMRLSIFAGGILAWDAVRRSGSGLADIAVVLAAIGLTSFLLTANPLWPADGYRWLSVRLQRPRLRGNAMRVLGLVIRLRPLPADLPRGEVRLLLLYAVVSLACTAAIIFLALSAVAYALEAQWRGAGVLIFCLLLAVVAMFLLDGRRRARIASRPSRGTGSSEAMGPRGPGTEGPSRRAMSLEREGSRDRHVAEAAGSALDAETGAPTGPLGRIEGADTMAQGAWGAAKGGEMPARPSDDPLADLLDPGPSDRGPGTTVPPPDPSTADDGLAGLLDESWPEEAWDEEDPASALAFDDGLGGPGTGTGAALGPDPSLDDILGPLPEPGRDVPAAGRGRGVEGNEDSHDAVAVDPTAGPGTRQPEGSVRVHGPGRSDSVMLRAPAAPVLRADPGPHPDRRPPPARFATDDLDRLLGVGSARPTPARRWRAAAIWIVVLGALAWVAFLPYPFAVGGEFTVQPLERAEARSRTDGEIIAVNVREGDWVEEGDVLAVLSNWDELRDVAVNEADGDKLMADLAALTSGASPEQVEVARQSVATAALRVEAAQKALEREQALFDAGTVSQSSLDDARAEFDLATASHAEAEAALAVVQAPARQPQIDSLNAAMARNEEELSFSRLLLEYTNIRAPAAGQVVSSLDDVPLGAFLPSGGLFAELEDNRTVIAEVEVPETTIAEVEVGAVAELRLWSDPETPIEGTVRSIAPRAEQRDFGWVIRVQVEVPNAEGRLAANMTGFGKIRAADRPVWQAFGRTLERFFVIELWSWVP